MAGPLTSLKVLDFSTLLPGPYATMLLADMGADVLRVEAPDRVDLTRVMPPHDAGVSTAHGFLNRGKKSLGLNLKEEGSREKVLELVKDYDVVVEQFRPGVMDRLGIGYEALKSVNPRLIYCSITGYGQTGPYKDRAGHDINYLSLAGVSSHCGRADSGPPPMGIQMQKPESALLNGGSFYDYYQTSDGRWLSVGSLEPQFSARLCDTLGISDMKSLAMSQKPEHQQQLKAAIKEKIAAKPLADWQEIFADQDACVEPVLTISEAAEHPQLKARDMVIGVDRGDGTHQPQIGFPIKFEKTPSQTSRIGKMLGADNDQFL